VFAVEKVGDYANVIFKSVFTTPKTYRQYTLYSQPIKVVDASVYMSISEINALLAKDLSQYTNTDKANIQKVERAFALLDASEQTQVVGMSKVPQILDKLTEYVVTVQNDNAKGMVTGVENGALYQKGTVLSNIQVTALNGYKIVSIKWNGQSENISSDKSASLSAKTISGNATLVVEYEPINYFVTIINDNAKGNISGVESGTPYIENTALSNIKITARQGYKIASVKWNGSYQTIINNLVVTLSPKTLLSDCTLEVVYESIPVEPSNPSEPIDPPEQDEPLVPEEPSDNGQEGALGCASTITTGGVPFVIISLACAFALCIKKMKNEN
jgi:hypothetical protein